MPSDRTDENLLFRYLLGELTEEEQVQVEDRAFADTAYLGTLEAVEADLIDAYVRRELTATQRREFEGRFLTSPQRRSKVEFARALAAVSAELKAVEAPARTSWWQSFLAQVRGMNSGLLLAGATAALVFVVGLSWLISGNAGLRTRLDALEAQRHNSVQREEGLRQQLGQEQERTRSLSAELQKQQGGVAPLVASLVLLPGLSRGESAREKLALPPSAQVAHIEIQLEPRDEYPRFRAELRTRSGVEVLVRSDLPRRKTSTGYVVSFDVPADALANGEYELTLKALPAGRPPEDIGYHYFSVQKQ